jgi:hypothetical protein
MNSRIDQLRLPKWEREQNTMPENSQPDLDFVYLSFNLIPINANGIKAAIAPGAITDIYYRETNDLYVIMLHGGRSYELSPVHMVKLEQAIRQRQEDTKILTRATLKEQKRTNYEVDQELMREIQGLISPAKLVRQN